METVGIALYVGNFGVEISLNVLHIVEHLAYHILGIVESREKLVPLGNMAAQSVALFNNYRCQPKFLKLCGGFHSGSTATYYNYILFHIDDIQTDLMHEGHCG